MSTVLDLGFGHRFTFTSSDVEMLESDASQAVGGIHDHPRPDTGEPCGGYVAFRGKRTAANPGPEWDVLSWEPLTLSPSLLCRTCGCHVWIREGRWVPE